MQHYGGSDLDGALLLIPQTGFLPPDDPRVVGTVAAIERELVRNGLVMRYTKDVVDPTREGAFLVCSFWLADAYVMLGTHETFAEFSKLPMGDPTTHALALYSFSVSSRDEVDRVSAAALAAGGTEADGAEDYGYMYSRSFFDLDGHGWQVMWMDPAAEQGPEELAATGA